MRQIVVYTGLTSLLVSALTSRMHCRTHLQEAIASAEHQPCCCRSVGLWVRQIVRLLPVMADDRRKAQQEPEGEMEGTETAAAAEAL